MATGRIMAASTSDTLDPTDWQTVYRRAAATVEETPFAGLCIRWNNFGDINSEFTCDKTSETPIDRIFPEDMSESFWRTLSQTDHAAYVLFAETVEKDYPGVRQSPDGHLMVAVIRRWGVWPIVASPFGVDLETFVEMLADCEPY